MFSEIRSIDIHMNDNAMIVGLADGSVRQLQVKRDAIEF